MSLSGGNRTNMAFPAGIQDEGRTRIRWGTGYIGAAHGCGKTHAGTSLGAPRNRKDHPLRRAIRPALDRQNSRKQDRKDRETAYENNFGASLRSKTHRTGPSLPGGILSTHSTQIAARLAVSFPFERITPGMGTGENTRAAGVRHETGDWALL